MVGYNWNRKHERITVLITVIQKGGEFMVHQEK